MLTSRKVGCPRCGTTNRVPQYSVDRRPRCGNCHAELPEAIPVRIARTLHRAPRLIWLAVVGACLGTWAIWSYGTDASVSMTASKDACTGRPLPRLGIYRWYTDADDVAPFTIRTAPGSNYFVKLVDLNGLPIRSFFAYGSSTMTNKVPLGTYALKYATGQSWCNERDLFGPGLLTITNQADRVFNFDRQVRYDDEGVRTSTTEITVELIKQKGGNLPTHAIDRSQF